ncbi:hypothetical protein RB595_003993 [Gaeumannomyces hyphopodioides]
MAPKPFRAIIVGGGVGGLTLANIFEQLAIDYVLLEAYRDFSPQVGASIAMLPGGQRILEQLGCNERFIEGVPSLDTSKPTIQGKPIFIFRGYNDNLIKRTGYGVSFNDRQVLLRVLHENIKDKSKLLLNKRVEKVTTTEAGATVETKDGDVFEGDIIVGLDGIRSTVREEMWRIASKASPGYFPKDEWKRVPINVKCLFGICRSHKRIPAGNVITAMYQGHSYLLMSGPEGKVYYFLFVKLPEPITADKTPRYSTEDAKALAEEHRHDPVVDDCTFGQVFDDSISFGMTPIHEHVFEKWHYGRIITLGDAAHKPNPISGHGGNGAMESVAELANQLKRRLDSSSGRLSARDIESVFRDTQAVRFERAKAFVQFSRDQQDFSAPSGWLGFFGIRMAPWLLTEEIMTEQQLHLAVDAVRIEGLPVPFRPHYIPWTGELPAKPIRHSWIPRVIVALALLALTYAAGYGIAEVKMVPESFLGHPFRDFYTGHQGTDHILDFLTKVFSVVVGSPTLESRLQVIYFLPMLTPMVLIWMVEAHRRGNLQTIPGRLVTWPSIYAVGYQLFSIARVGPIYFLASMFVGRKDMYYRQSSRVVDQDVARALLPAVSLGFVLPTVCMLLPLWGAPAAWLDFITVWQVAPVLVGPLTSFLASVIRSARRTGDKTKAAAAAAAEDDAAAAHGGVPVVGSVGNFDLYKNIDLPHLLAAYMAAFYGAAALHVAVAVYVLASPDVSLRGVFLNLPCWPWSDGAATWNVDAGSAAEVATVLFRWDFVVYAATLLVWCLHSVAEMRRVGYVRTADACRAAAAVAASFVLVGPGAMYAATWYWREKVIAGQSRMEEGEEKKVR